MELSPNGLEITVGALHLVLDAFDLEIGDLGEADRVEVGIGLLRLSAELGERLDRR